MKDLKLQGASLEYLEDHPEHFEIVVKRVKKGVHISVKETLMNGIPVTQVEGGKIIQKFPNGKTMVIGKAKKGESVIPGTRRAL